MCVAEIDQAVLKLLRSKAATGNPRRSRKLSFSDFPNFPIGDENDLTVHQQFSVISYLSLFL